MPAYECLVCGTAFYSLGRIDPRCHSCGGERFHASVPGQSPTRYPQQFYPGEHASFIFGSDRRFLAVLAPYVRAGLTGGDRVVGVVESRLADLLKQELRSEEAERVEWVDPSIQYEMSFNSERACERYEAMVEETHGVLRMFGGLDPATAGAVDPAEWDRYEVIVDEVIARGAIALCLYDARYGSPELLDTAVGRHGLLTGSQVVHVCG